MLVKFKISFDICFEREKCFNMAAALNGVLPTSLQEKINTSNLLVVGAGGIGCEILKNLVLSGFPEIEIVRINYKFVL